eukprot:m.503353 g.503353  ORF g.503353 m.503353 type:complete len:54 (+) comp21845_c0_seq10:1693-1854(+)
MNDAAFNGRLHLKNTVPNNDWHSDEPPDVLRLHDLLAFNIALLHRGDLAQMPL